MEKLTLLVTGKKIAFPTQQREYSTFKLFRPPYHTPELNSRTTHTRQPISRSLSLPQHHLSHRHESQPLIKTPAILCRRLQIYRRLLLRGSRLIVPNDCGAQSLPAPLLQSPQEKNIEILLALAQRFRLAGFRFTRHLRE